MTVQLLNMPVQLLILALVFSAGVYADEGGSAQITVVDQNGTPLKGIVVEVVGPDSAQSNNEPAVMKQIEQQFVPHILAVQQGTHVLFPDTDNVRHHVYSFSSAKTFEIAIGQQNIPREIHFDKPGIAELGCNIHDWMLGYIYIAQSAWFMQTNDSGQARFSNIPAGQHHIKIWHPRLNNTDIQILHPLIISGQQAELTITLTEPIAPSYAEFDEVEGIGNY